MIEKNSKIFLTYSLGGKYLIKSGKYSVAKINKGIIESPSRTIEEPIYEDTKVTLTLSEAFVQNALEIPKNPHKRGSNEYHRWFRSSLGKLLLDWPKLNEEQKIQRHIEMYIEDMVGFLSEYDYKII